MDGGKMKKTNRALWIVILTLSLTVVIGCVIFLFVYLMQPGDIFPHTTVKPTAAPPDESVAAATDEPTEAPTEKPTINSFGYEMETYEEWTQLSFEELMDINPDIYAWIYIPDTNVDYPVAQSMNGDDSFYLSHNIYRQYQFSGTIYSEFQNATDFSDPVTVLYGHNMLNGSMFATLHYFTDEKFFDEHTTCFILTRDKVYTYLIYAAYVYDDRHILNSNNFSDEDVLLNYFDSTLNPHTYSGNVREGVALDKDSRVLTLSTCTNGASNTRYLVQGVLVDEQLRE